MLFDIFHNKTESPLIHAGAVLTALLLFAIPFSTSVTSIIPIIIFLIWLLSGQFLHCIQLFKQNSTAFFAFLLFLLLAIAVSYSTEAITDALYALKKYRELLLIMILAPFLAEEKYRQWAFYAFISASIITLLSSYLIYLELVPGPESAWGSPSIRMRITHSLFIAFFAFYCAHQCINHLRYRVVWGALFILSTFNIFFMIEGRTGQLIYLLLILLFSWQRLNKQKATIFIALNIVFFILFLNFSAGGNRFHEGISNTQSYMQGQSETRSSMGQRLTFWKHALALVIEKPALGHGTGSFTSAYLRLASENEMKTSNPHSEFLMLAVQTGLPGLLLFCAMLFSLYQNSRLLAPDYQWFAQGTLLTLIINSLLNSTILDNTEGHWFACLIALSLAPLSTAHVSEQ